MPTTKKAAAPPSADDGDHGTITTRQMRELHALLRDHGITGDKAVHDYIAVALAEQGADPVESRKDLTATAAAHLINTLAEAEVKVSAGDGRLAALRAPFPEGEVGKLPRSTCRACSDNPRKRCQEHAWVSNCPQCHGGHSAATMHIDYVGHADVTARLLEVDPHWSWEPMAYGPDGRPNVAASTDRDGNLWINLTVLGVTRPGVGDGKNAKERIGDALRNAAMRFGVALDLWAKGDRDWAHAEKAGEQHPDTPADREQTADQRQPAPAQEWHGPTTPELLAMIDAHAARAGVTYEQITAKWRAANGDLALDALETLPPQAVAQLEASIAAYLREHPPTATP